MIISVYPTTGKSTIASNYDHIIDLDTKSFNDIKKDYDKWWKIYCDIALELEKQHKIVLIWTDNENVHEYLKTNAKSYHIIIYNKNLKDYVFQKAIERDKIIPRPKTTYYILNKFDIVIDKILNISEKYNIDLYMIEDENYDLKYIIDNNLKETKM